MEVIVFIVLLMIVFLITLKWTRRGTIKDKFFDSYLVSLLGLLVFNIIFIEVILIQNKIETEKLPIIKVEGDKYYYTDSLYVKKDKPVDSVEIIESTNKLGGLLFMIPDSMKIVKPLYIE